MNPYLGEFLGTMILILLGGGVVAGVLLAKSKAQNAGWIVITDGMGDRGDGGRLNRGGGWRGRGTSIPSGPWRGC